MNFKISKTIVIVLMFWIILFAMPHRTTSQENNSPLLENQQPREKSIEISPNSLYEPLRPPQCGESKAIHNRVVRGSPSVLGAWPWIVALGYSTSSPEFVDFRCGGALISSRHVITAAHCILDELMLVRLGEHDLSSNEDGANIIDVLIQKASVHPKYDESTLRNDIAILKLSKDVKLTDTIHPICLPLAGDVKYRDYVGTFPFVAGWGEIFLNSTKNYILREVQLPVINNERCKAAYRNIKYADVNDNVLCAGYAQGGKDACHGDSGDPFMFAIGPTYYLIGVVSAGFECAKPGFFWYLYSSLFFPQLYQIKYELSNLIE